MITAKRTYTLADLPDRPEDRIYDTLGGTLVVLNVPDDNHSEVLTVLFGMLYAAREAGYGNVYAGTRAVALDFPQRGNAAQDVTHPDLFFIRQERVETLRGRRAVEGVPDLVVEVLSKTTRAEHRPGGDLWQAYERHGLPYYWLIDTTRRRVAQYALIGEHYVSGYFGEPVVLQEGDVLTSPLFPSMSLSVDRLFRHVRDWG